MVAFLEKSEPKRRLLEQEACMDIAVDHDLWPKYKRFMVRPFALRQGSFAMRRSVKGFFLATG